MLQAATRSELVDPNYSNTRIHTLLLLTFVTNLPLEMC
jgi:hypothetical protein